jgi:DNA polymerase
MGERLIIPMFHPAAALHQPSLKQAVLDDFSHLPAFIQQAHKARDARYPAVPVEPEPPEPQDSTPTQLSLF